MTDVLPVSAVVIARVREERHARKLSGQKLADAMSAAGFSISRSVLANVEGGRVREISVDFAATAALILRVPLLSLLPKCITCNDEPPAGFTCNTCGGAL